MVPAGTSFARHRLRSCAPSQYGHGPCRAAYRPAVAVWQRCVIDSWYARAVRPAAIVWLNTVGAAGRQPLAPTEQSELTPKVLPPQIAR